MRRHFVSIYEVYDGKPAFNIIIDFINRNMKDIIEGKWNKYVSSNNCRIDGFNINSLTIHNNAFYAIDTKNDTQLIMKPVYKIPFGIERIDGKDVLVRYFIENVGQGFLSV